MVFVFGACELDLNRRELRRASVVQAIEPKPFAVLVHLLMQRHRAVSKDELLAACWPGEHVTEAALTRCLRVIRRAVAEDGVQQHVIKTLRGHGYRFVAAVATPSTSASVRPPHNHTAARERLAPAVAADATPGLAATTLPALGPETPWGQGQTRNRAARQFCAACRQSLWQPCRHCGVRNSPGEHFCGGCGGAVAVAGPLITSARTGLQWAATPEPPTPHILARQQAGTMAFERAAFREAVSFFEQALQPLAHLPEDRDTSALALDLRLAVVPALNALGEFGQSLARLGEAEALPRARDNRSRLGRLLATTVRVLRRTADYAGAAASGQQALAVAAALDEPTLQLSAALSLGQV